jgi:ketosteroid isomerase-like protein
MKNSGLLPLALFVLIPLLARGSAEPASSVMSSLATLEERWVNAERDHDAATLREILDERFLYIGLTRVRTREEFIASVTSGPVDPTLSQTLTDRLFLTDGDTAVLTEVDTIRATENGQPVESRYRVTTTYLRREGRWRALAEMMVRIPLSAPPAKS